MSFLKLKHNGLDYPTPNFGGLNNLRRIMARNDDNYESFINMGNRVLPNQNVLVQFLLLFSVNVEWTENYLITVIDSKINQNASVVDFVSIYNRGKNHPLSVYPETNHNTLLVVPYGKPDRPQINGYFNDEINSLVPLYPIYTSDLIQRWDISGMFDTATHKLPSETYSIVQIDVYALVIGYWRWLKQNRNVGNSPHAYLCNFPLMNCYLYHSELVNFNYLNKNKVSIDRGPWILEDYSQQLTDYTDFKNRYMMTEHMKSFTHYFDVNKGTNISVDTRKMMFPDFYKSGWFTQMSWAWTLASMGNLYPYLNYNRLLGSVDGELEGVLNKFLRIPVSSITTQIKDPRWAEHFAMVYKSIKDKQ